MILGSTAPHLPGRGLSGGAAFAVDLREAGRPYGRSEPKRKYQGARAAVNVMRVAVAQRIAFIGPGSGADAVGEKIRGWRVSE
jgi:hypothetical protein